LKNFGVVFVLVKYREIGWGRELKVEGIMFLFSFILEEYCFD